MEKKYILTDETIIVEGRKLHRIKAVKDFSLIEKGDLGGWIEKEENLSHEGTCWVYYPAMVFDRAAIRQDATVCGSSKIYDQAIVSNHAVVLDSCVFGQAGLLGDSCVRESSVFGNARVRQNAHIQCGAKVCGNAIVDGSAFIHNGAEVHGFVVIDGNVNIGWAINISSIDQILNIGPIGSRNDYTTFVDVLNGNIMVFCGCFSGTIDSFEQKVRYIHAGTKFEKDYLNAISYAKTHFSSQ